MECTATNSTYKNFFTWRKAMMKIRGVVLIVFLFVTLAYAGCQETRPERNYLQANIFEKNVFQGDWYYVRTVIDHDYESSWMGAYGTFIGDQTASAELWTLERITWIIDEDYLYAYRTVPIVSGADSDEVRSDFREDLVAAFKIVSHFDIMRRYNPYTGEELNVIEENEQERPWYERKYMRVDWSQNLVIGYYWNSLDAYGMLGYFDREPVPLYCGEGSEQGFQIEGSCSDGVDNNGDGTCDAAGCTVKYVVDGQKVVRHLPPDPICQGDEEASELETYSVCKPQWLPVIRFTSQDFDSAYGTYYTKELEQEGYPEGTPYYFSFVTQEMWTPDPEKVLIEGMGWGYYPLTSARVTIRNSFLRSPERSRYEPLLVTDSLWDHFGIIRMQQEVYMGGEGEGDTDDPDDVIKQDRGYVDFKNYWGARHNIWVDYRDEEGNVIPAKDREVRKVVYYLTENFPKWLILTAFEVVAEWNRSMMDAVALAKGGDKGDSYDCRVIHGNVAENPEKFSDYESLLDDPANFPHFEGQDCVLILRVNSRDLIASDAIAPGTYRFVDSAGERIITKLPDGSIDPATSNVDPFGEQLGDIRFKFFGVIDTPGAWFAGVTLPLMDPRTGELINSNVYIVRDAYEGVMTSVLLDLGIAGDLCQSDSMDFRDDELNSLYSDICSYLANLDLPDIEKVINGDYVREYFSNRGRVDSAPQPVIPEALSGVPSPPSGGVYSSVLGNLFQQMAQRQAERIQMLKGTDGKLRLFSERLRRLKGTDFERMVFDNPEMYLLSVGDFNRIIMDPSKPVPEDVLDKVSFIRRSFAEQRYSIRKSFMKKIEHFMEPHNPFIDYSLVRIARDYMEKGYNASQIAMNIGQLYFKSVMLHEMGHGIGMEHNFAGSIDFNNYHDEYYNIVNVTQCVKEACGEPESGGNTPEREALNCWPCPDNLGPVMTDMSVEQSYQWGKEVARIERKREMLGINQWMTSSIMDYLPEIYDDFAGLGKYDKAFVLFSYANKVEGYKGDPRLQKASSMWDRFLLDPRQVNTEDNTSTPLDKVYWNHYAGGEECNVDADCPFNEATGEIPESQRRSGIYQRCVVSPRLVRDYQCIVDDNCGGNMVCRYGLCMSSCSGDGDCSDNEVCDSGVCVERCTDDSGCGYGYNCEQRDESTSVCRPMRVCSNYFEDAKIFAEKAATRSQLEYYPVRYMFCSNNRTNDISWCNMFDEGGSFREVVRNLRDFYHRIYPYADFRRHRRDFYGGVYWFIFEIMGKIYQHLYYRYFYELGFRDIEGPLGFYDMYLANIYSLNFFAEILATPDVGSYEYDEDKNMFYKVDDELGKGTLDVPLGIGKYMWSAFQDGYMGIFKLERQGVHIDKLYTLIALSIRDWGTSYTYDERFWFNFYDLFPLETLEIIGGVILDDPKYYGARWITDPDSGGKRLAFTDLWHYSYCPRGSDWDNCDPSHPYYPPRSWEAYEQMDPVPPVIGNGSNEILRNYALMMSLAEFPIFFDTTYEQQMFICERGSGYCFDICEQPDVDGGTAYYFCNDPEVTPLVPGEDFVTYTSRRLHKTFQAVQVEKLFPSSVAPLDIAMELLRKANQLQDSLTIYQQHQAAGTCPEGFPPPCDEMLEKEIERLSQQLVETESFITNVINIQREYGISSWLI